jgi:RNA polymerase sigma-70 factor, ECF subfamily
MGATPQAVGPAEPAQSLPQAALSLGSRPAVPAAAELQPAGNPFCFISPPPGGTVLRMDRTDAEVIAAVLNGNTADFEALVTKYLPRVFAAARRYARRESEVEDIVQEVWLKAYQKLRTFRNEAPFEHWLMRLTVRTCYDFLRAHQRNREATFSELSDDEHDWLAHCGTAPSDATEASSAARALVERLLAMLSPPSRLIITLLELEERSVKEIAQLTGWSIPLVKVRAFRARAEMKKCLARIAQGKYL